MNIDELQDELKKRIQNIDKRIDKFSKLNNTSYDWSKKIERLHSEAWAYEKVIRMIEED